jgi:hypothetical protein
MRCRFCRAEMAYVHGHAACVDNRCPFFGQNQAECCDGETMERSPAPTADVAATPWRPPEDGSDTA